MSHWGFHLPFAVAYIAKGSPGEVSGTRELVSSNLQMYFPVSPALSKRGFAAQWIGEGSCALSAVPHALVAHFFPTPPPCTFDSIQQSV